MPQAQCELGLIYEHGLGVPLDYKKVSIGAALQPNNSTPRCKPKG